MQNKYLGQTLRQNLFHNLGGTAVHIDGLYLAFCGDFRRAVVFSQEIETFHLMITPYGLNVYLRVKQETLRNQQGIQFLTRRKQAHKICGVGDNLQVNLTPHFADKGHLKRNQILQMIIRNQNSWLFHVASP